MGDIQWGWTPKQVYRHLKKNIEASYQEPISKTTDAIEEDRLRHKMAEEARQIRDSYFEFDGTPSAYDSGYLKGEFTHKNGESLIRVRTKNTQDYFFFIKERLWKRYRAFDASVFEGATFAQFGNALQQRYGKAKKKTGVPPRPVASPCTVVRVERAPSVRAGRRQQRILRFLLPDSRGSRRRSRDSAAAKEQARARPRPAIRWSTWLLTKATTTSTPTLRTGSPARFGVTTLRTSTKRNSNRRRWG